MKRNKKSVQESYDMIMKQLSKHVKRLIEEYTDDDIEECGYADYDEVEECGDEDVDECNESRKHMRRRSSRVNEMARAAVNRTINPKALANVRDAASRRDFDKDWAINAVPKPSFNDEELLHRYVAALLVYRQPCPETEEEIDEIGIFKNYAHKLIDEGTGTLEDIQTLYAQQDKIADRQRRGTARKVKGWRKSDAVPSEDFDFDKEENNVPEPEIEEEPISSEQDYPDYDEVESNDEVFDESSYKKDIDNIEAITYEEFEDPEMNSSFVHFNDDVIKMNGSKIGFDVIIKNDDESETEVSSVWGDTFGEALRKVTIATLASLSSTGEYFTIEVSKVIQRFRKRYTQSLDENSKDELDDEAEDMKVKVFDSAANIKDAARALSNY